VVDEHAPRIEERGEQPFVAIRTTATMETLGTVVDSTFPRLFAWLAERDIAFTGAPFIRYLVIDMEGELLLEMGAPVQHATPGDDAVITGVLPAGRYATLRHIGPYDGLVASNAALQRWAEQHDIRWDAEETDAGTGWRNRLEVYVTDPSAEPDPGKWVVDLAYLIADG
jgi:effector-binding domain-containing protein